MVSRQKFCALAMNSVVCQLCGETHEMAKLVTVLVKDGRYPIDDGSVAVDGGVESRELSVCQRCFVFAARESNNPVVLHVELTNLMEKLLAELKRKKRNFLVGDYVHYYDKGAQTVYYCRIKDLLLGNKALLFFRDDVLTVREDELIATLDDVLSQLTVDASKVRFVS